MPRQRSTSANNRSRREALIEQRSRRDEETARFYLSHAADRARIIVGKERVVIDLSNLAANTNRFAVIQHINQLAGEYGLKPSTKQTDTNPNKLHFKKSASS